MEPEEPVQPTNQPINQEAVPPPQPQPPAPEPMPEILPAAAATEQPPAGIVHEIPKKRNGFVLFLIILLILVSLGSLGYWVYQKYFAPSPVASPEPSGQAVVPTATPDVTANWKTYTDPNNQFSFKYPPSYSLDTTVASYLNRNITWRFNNISVLDCKGDCPVIEAKDNSSLGGQSTTKVSGYIGSIGGNIPQRYVTYETKSGSKYFVFSIQALPFIMTKDEFAKYDPSVTQNIKPEDQTTFDQILSTLKFLGQTTSTNTTLSMTGTLQDYMKANCKPGNPQYLELQKLPVNIDTNIIKPFQTANGDTVYCSSTDDNTKPIKGGYLVIRLDNSNGINIYDDQSQELGHGGAPGLGFFGQKIFDQNGIQMGTWLQGGDGPQVLGDVGMFLRGVKKFTTKDGHVIYINYTQRAIPGSDARLMSQLKPYSSIDPNLGLNEPTVNYDQTVSAKIVDFFFGKTPNTASPEGQSMQNMKGILSAVTVK